MRTVLAAVVLILMIAVPTAAGPYEDGLGAYDSGENEIALQLLRPFAEQGDPLAQSVVGQIFLRKAFNLRIGGNDELREAQKWFRLAAEQGFAPAQERLGYTYELPLFEDSSEAMKWYRFAAEQGHVQAMASLAGHLAWDFELTRRNPEEAAMWYLKAADNGYIEAFIALSTMYDKGHGVPKDHVVALEWKMRIVEHGKVAKIADDVARHYERGRGVKQDNVVAYMWDEIGVLAGAKKTTEISRNILSQKMTAADIATAQRKAREWMAKHQSQ